MLRPWLLAATALCALPVLLAPRAAGAQQLAQAEAPAAPGVASPGIAVRPGFGGDLSGDAAPGASRSLLAPDVRLGTFLDPLFETRARPAAGAAAERPYDILYSLSSRVRFTDNVGLSANNRRSDTSIAVIPGVRLVAQTPLLTGSIAYTPSFNFNLSDNQPDRITHRFFGTGTLTLLPERLFVDFRALGTVNPLASGLPENTVLPGTRSSFSQSQFFSVSPYYIQPLGTFATALVGYQFQYSRRSSPTLTLNPDGTGPIVAAPEALRVQTVHGAVRTGDDFGRLTMEVRGRGSFFAGGSNVTEGAHRHLGLFEARYALTRTVSVLGEVGYEDIEFGGTNPFIRRGMVWGGGVRWDPNENTSITVRYRRRDGIDAPQADLRVGLGPRTVLTGRYSDGVTTSLRATADLLSQVTYDDDGNPVDARSGEPSRELTGGGFLAPQSGLFRNRNGRLAVTHFFQRDTFTLAYAHVNRTPLSVATGQLAFAQTTDNINLLWRRPLDESTAVFASTGYGWLRSSTLGSRSQTISGRLGVTHSFNDWLSGSLQYQLTHRMRSRAGDAGILAPTDATQNTVIGQLTARF
jgi:uncharacterized protein (PEP-CTERM system associated)